MNLSASCTVLLSASTVPFCREGDAILAIKTVHAKQSAKSAGTQKRGTGSLKHPALTVHGSAIKTSMKRTTPAHYALGQTLTQRWC